MIPAGPNQLDQMAVLAIFTLLTTFMSVTVQLKEIYLVLMI